MRTVILLYSFFLLLSCREEGSRNADRTAFQRLEVIAGPGDIQGMLYMEEAANLSGPWMRVDSFPVVLGKNGLAFPGEKREGDGHSPSGTFALSMGFCYTDPGGLSYPLVVVDSNDICVDDTLSAQYNTHVRKDSLQSVPASFEYLHRKDELYAFGIWVDYNTDPQISGAGSCIFLHIWKNAHSPTSGCTAMDKNNMLRLLRWLDPDKNPFLYQHLR